MQELFCDLQSRSRSIGANLWKLLFQAIMQELFCDHAQALSFNRSLRCRSYSARSATIELFYLSCSAGAVLPSCYVEAALQSYTEAIMPELLCEFMLGLLC